MKRELFVKIEDALTRVEIDNASASVEIHSLKEGENAELSIDRNKGTPLTGDSKCEHTYSVNGETLQISIDSDYSSCRQKISLRVPANATFRINGTSGKVNAFGLTGSDVEIIASSGNVVYEGGASISGSEQNLRMKATSGHISARLPSATEHASVKMESTSGNIDLAVPSDSEFAVEINTNSGNINNEHGKISKMASRQISIDTTSGNISLR